jgi:lysine 2,3-aminomutase
MADDPTRQPYAYGRRPLVEPDWRRLPGWRGVTPDQWRDAQWQRVHCVRNLRQLRALLGDLLPDDVYDDLAADAAQFASMPMLVPPQMLNTISSTVDGFGYAAAFRTDPIRRYMLPMRSDRDPHWPSHPYAERDSLHETQMWVTEGLTHRYPTKVLAELVTTCPQYCGHCTRMDLVGPSTPQVTKARFALRPAGREELMLDYLKRTPTVRDVVVSGGDVANIPWHQLERFLLQLLDLESVRDIRLATKALIGLPQHWLQPAVLDGVARVASLAASRGVHLAVHTHANHAASVTPLVAQAARALLAAGVRDVRNQGVLLAGVNATAPDLLDLCFALHGEAGIVPYYFYLCDMIPNAEHWRIPVHAAQRLQEAILGYLPGYATPRLVCDVPYVGKRWVHQIVAYDRERGISSWTKNYSTLLENPADPERAYHYYDPISTLPDAGRRWWSAHTIREDQHVPLRLG